MIPNPRFLLVRWTRSSEPSKFLIIIWIWFCFRKFSIVPRSRSPSSEPYCVRYLNQTRIVIFSFDCRWSGARVNWNGIVPYLWDCFRRNIFVLSVLLINKLDKKKNGAQNKHHNTHFFIRWISNQFTLKKKKNQTKRQASMKGFHNDSSTEQSKKDDGEWCLVFPHARHL